MQVKNFIGALYVLGDFKWNKETRTLVSTLTTVPKCLRTLWKDSLDIGFGVKSEKTGKIAYFVLDCIDKNDDGEVYAWHFRSLNPENRPEFVELKAMIKR